MAFTNLSGIFIYKLLLTATRMDQLADNTLSNNFASGTSMIFFQASAPTGWTQDTDNTDAALRVVSGSGGGTGGSQGFVTHTHAIPSDGDHAHTIGGAGAEVNFAGTPDEKRVTSSAGAHTHGGGTSAATLKHIDCIVCTKD